MYKTVRHGENSLQYKILAQQEDGVPGVKRRRSPKTFVLRLIAILTLLIIGITASAFLVPLFLTNDFIAVTGTFQKFSVSTLRRSHSGSHVVVIAKKPYGWNAAHPTPFPSQSNASQSHSDPETSTLPVNPLHTTSKSHYTPPTTPTPHHTAADTTTLRLQSPRNKASTTETTAGSAVGTRGWAKFSLKTTAPPRQQILQKEPTDEVDSSKLEPNEWFNPIKKWPFQSFDGSGGKTIAEKWFLYLVAGFLVTVVIIGVILSKALCRRRKEETEQSKEDKKRLLKPSVSSDHDEE